MKNICICITFLFMMAESCLAIPPDKIPFGICFNSDVSRNIANSTLDSLSKILGFNFCYPIDTDPGLSQDILNNMRRHGLDVIPYMTDSANPNVTQAYRSYLNAHYILMKARNISDSTRFVTRHGYDSTDVNWYVAPRSDSSFIFLDDLWFDHEWRYIKGTVQYQPSLRLRVYPDRNMQADTVAILNIYECVGDWWGDQAALNRHKTLFKSFPILKSRFPSDEPVILDLPSFSKDYFSTAVMTYQIVSDGHWSFAIDWIKISNSDGEDIMAGKYDSVFADYVRHDTTALYWMLRDDMRTDQLSPARHADSIINANSDKGSMMKFYEGFVVSPKEMVTAGRPHRFWIERYPFHGGSGGQSCTGGVRTAHYGFGQDTTAHTMGLQMFFDLFVNSRIAWIKEATGDSIELWYMAQMQSNKFADSCQNAMERRPTGPEMRMEAFNALTYGVRGLQYWPFGSEGSGPSGFLFCGLDSMRSDGRWQTTVAWDRLKNYVTSYIQALGKYYTSLTWERSYSSHQIVASGYYLSSIRGWSDSPNPDTGWAQIGEFHNGNDKYIMLVNRACSSDSLGTEAPPQHFSLLLNSSKMKLGDKVLIIDLAKTVYHSAKNGWEGIPDTSIAKMQSDGTFHYSITLAAGEGRLLKIITAPAVRKAR